MNIEVSRRHFMKLTGAGVAGTAIGAFGFGEAEQALAQAIRPFKLAKLTETRNTCPYCSVGCGIIMYSQGDLKKGEKAEIKHIEGDPDHPTNKGTLCPKGAALLDFVKSETRTQFPMVREPGSNAWKRLSWDQALDRNARMMQDAPRRQLHHQEQGRPDRKPLAHDRRARRVGYNQRDGVPDL